MERQLEHEIERMESKWEAYRRVLGVFWLMKSRLREDIFHAYLWKFFIFWVQQGNTEVRINTMQDMYAFVWLFNHVAGHLRRSHTRMTDKDEQLYYRVLIKSQERQWFASQELHSQFMALTSQGTIRLFSIVIDNYNQDSSVDVNEIHKSASAKSTAALKMIAFLWNKLFQLLGEVSGVFLESSLRDPAISFCELIVFQYSIQVLLNQHEAELTPFFNAAFSNLSFVEACFEHIAATNTSHSLAIAANVKYMFKTHIIKSGVSEQPAKTFSLLESYLRAFDSYLATNLQISLISHERIHQKKNLNAVSREIRTGASLSHFALLTQLMEVASSKGDSQVLSQYSAERLVSLCAHLCTVHHKLLTIARSSEFGSLFSYTHKLWMKIFWFALKKSVSLWSERPGGQFSIILSTFCTSYTDHLEQLSDDEFISNQGALSVQEATKVAYIMKHLIFSLYTESVTDQKTLRRRIQHMLHLLYDIDMRRNWAPENHWILPLAERIEFSNLEGADMSFLDEETDARDLMDIEESSITTQGPVERLRLQRSSRKKILSKDVLWSILNHIPFILSFEKRLGIFTHFVRQEQVNLSRRFMRPVTIRRDRIFDDAFTKLSHLNLKQTLNIQFESNGEVEEGIGAGVQKEFLTLLAADAFSVQYGLFVETPQKGRIYPNPHFDIASDDPIEKYEFLGQVIAACVFFRILVDVPVTSFFLKQILGKKNTINDLFEYDPQLFKNLMYIKQHDVTDMGLTFSVGDDVFGEQREVELIPNGATIAVTNENKEKYLSEVANFRLNKQIKVQSRAFSRGMRQVINEKWLDLFSERELRLLISGGNAPISVEDWRKNSIYGNVRSTDLLIEWFWDIVNNDFEEEDKRKLLKFVTASTSPPIEGFSALEPKFAISVDIYSDPNRLPSSSTCVNLLKTPRYRSREQLKQKLLKAIREVDTFELT